MILYTSATNLKYLLATIFVALFGAIYECFSHGVYTYYMIYAFAFPLVLGLLPSVIFNMIKVKYTFPKLGLEFYNTGIASLTVGSVVKGILIIYGTENELINIYFIVGSLLLLIGILTLLIKKNKITY